jgi:soluble lytic murein transglycosylase-like protein
VPFVVVAAGGCDAARGGNDPGFVDPSVSGVVRAPGLSGTSQPSPARAGNQDPARFAGQVHAHAQTAAVNPQLLMAILYNESDKPHDPALERAWQKVKPDAAFGVANMHKAAFDDTRRGRDFAHRDWQELPDDPDLAIKAAAWYLHDLATQLPATWSGPYTRDELLALGYNAGAGAMKAFARNAKPGQVAQAYLDRLRGNWPAAEQAVHPR